MLGIALLLAQSSFAVDLSAGANKASLVAQVKSAPSESEMEVLHSIALTRRGSGAKNNPTYGAWWNAKKAAEQLARQGAIDELESLSRDPSTTVAAAAIEGLRTSPPSARVVAILRSAIRRGGRPRDAALRLLDNQGPAAVAAVPELLSVAKEQNADRVLALQCLKRLGPAAASAVPTVARLLAPKGLFLDEIAETLAALGPVGVKALVKAMKSPDKEVRDAAYHMGSDLDDLEAKAAAREIDGSYSVETLRSADANTR